MNTIIYDDDFKEVQDGIFISNGVKNKDVNHYDLWNGFEAIDVIKQVLTRDEYIGYLKGNILKYQLRLSKKDSIEKEVTKIKDYTRELNSLL